MLHMKSEVSQILLMEFDDVLSTDVDAFNHYRNPDIKRLWPFGGGCIS